MRRIDGIYSKRTKKKPTYRLYPKVIFSPTKAANLTGKIEPYTIRP